MNMPKILQVVRPTEGGIGKHILTLVSGIRDRFNVTVACPDSGFPAEELRASGIKVLPLPLAGEISLRNDLRALSIMARFMAQQRIELVHSHGAKAALLARPAGLLAGVPVLLYTVHNSINRANQPAWKNKTLTAVERVLSRATDCIITVSGALREEIAGVGGIHRDKIKVIRNGITLDHLQAFASRDKWREKWNLPRNYTVIGTVARMAPQKGLHTMVSAAEQLVCKDGYNVHFLMAGDGPLKGELERMVQAAKLDHRFTFTGMVTDIATVYAALDIFVLPSLTEGLPLSLLEAMACGLPVTVTAVGGIPEIVRHEENGLLVNPGRPGELAGGIARLLEDPVFAGELGKRARQDVFRDFTAEKMVASTINLYLQLIKEKGLSATGDELVLACK